MTDPAFLAPRPPGLEALFDALPVACAALDASLNVLYANRAFETLMGRVAPGSTLHGLLRIEDSLLPATIEQKLRAKLPDGAAVTLHLAPAPFGRMAVVQHAARDEVEGKALLALGRDTIAATSEEEVVAALSRVLRALFPGAFACVRVVDPRTYALTSLYAEGKLLPHARQQLAISRSAAEKLGLQRVALPAERVRVVDEPPLVFDRSVRGSCTPLVAAGQLFGVLNVEFPAGDTRDLRADERVVIRVANQAALGLRNVKLLEEVSYVRRYLEQLIEHANALIVVVNAESQVIVFNQAMARLSGHRSEQVLGRPFLDFIPADEHTRVQRLVVRSLHGGPVANFETAMQHADGRKLRVAFSTAAVRSASGEIEGVIAVGQDLTQLKSLENQVIQAEKLSSLGQLAAGVAHEINNPLTTISIYADALGRKLRQALAMEATFEGSEPGMKRPVTYGDASDMEKLGRIGEATDRIMKLSRDLTSYARPAPDGVEPVPLKDALDRAVGFCDHVLKSSGVELVRQYPTTLTVLGRRSQLVQVFVNLITNACHATGEGGVVTLQAEAAKGAVAVTVRDTGSGIEAKHLPRLFEPFFTTKAEGKGTGLGLSIVQGIVTQHGGTVTVESEPGRGTTFTVKLPSGDEAA